jgi:hypothetical protein
MLVLKENKDLIGLKGELRKYHSSVELTFTGSPELFPCFCFHSLTRDLQGFKVRFHSLPFSKARQILETENLKKNNK